MITKERLEQFKSLYQKHYGATLSDEDAFDKLLNLFELYQTIYAGLEAGLIGKKVENRELSSQRTAQGF